MSVSKVQEQENNKKASEKIAVQAEVVKDFIQEVEEEYVDNALQLRELISEKKEIEDKVKEIEQTQDSSRTTTHRLDNDKAAALEAEKKRLDNLANDAEFMAKHLEISEHFVSIIKGLDENHEKNLEREYGSDLTDQEKLAAKGINKDMLVQHAEVFKLLNSNASAPKPSSFANRPPDNATAEQIYQHEIASIIEQAQKPGINNLEMAVLQQKARQCAAKYGLEVWKKTHPGEKEEKYNNSKEMKFYASEGNTIASEIHATIRARRTLERKHNVKPGQSVLNSGAPNPANAGGARKNKKQNHGTESAPVRPK